MPPKLPSNGTAISLLITIGTLIAAILGGWWAIEARVDARIDTRQEPLVRQVEEVKKAVTEVRSELNRLNRGQGEINGTLGVIKSLLERERRPR